MTTFTLRLHAAQRKAKAAHMALPRVNWKLVAWGVALASLCLLVVYIYSVNALTKGTYLVRSYEAQAVELQNQNSALQTQFAESGFLQSVQAQALALGFQKTEGVTYVQLPAHDVAMLK